MYVGAGDCVLGSDTCEMVMINPTSNTSPDARFAHAAATVERTPNVLSMVIVGGVTPEADLSDVAIWTPTPPPSLTNVPASDLD